jgi:hypothetical protein
MTDVDKQKARSLLAHVDRHAGHLEDCTTRSSFGDPSSDYCTCGFAGARAAFYELLEMLKK